LIYAGSDAWFNAHILSNRVMVYIGLISYPLYLWHWPLLAYAKMLDMGGLYERAGVIAVSFVVAYFTYILVEKPIRYGTTKVTGRLILAMSLVLLVGIAILMGSLRPLHDSDEVRRISRAIGEWEYPGKMRAFVDGNKQYYRINQVKQTATPVEKIVYFGDSNIEQYYSNIDELSHKSDKDIVFATESGCPPLLNIHRDKYSQCDKFAEDVLSYLQRNDVKTVVIGAMWYKYFYDESTYHTKGDTQGNVATLNEPEGRAQGFKSLETMLMQLNAMGKTTYLVLNIPTGRALGPNKMVYRSLHDRDAFFSFNYDGLREQELDKYLDIDAKLKAIALRTNTVVIDPKLFLCTDGQCPSITGDGEPMYKDGGHLRPSFVRTHIHFLEQTLN